jgi:hypothetical protein
MNRLSIFSVLVAVALFNGAFDVPTDAQDSPRDVLEQFCDLDAQGVQLTPDGWQKIAQLFVGPSVPRRGRIIVVKDFVVSRPELKTNRAEFYVEYVQLGEIVSAAAKFSHLPMLKVRAGFNLAKTEEDSKSGRRDDSVQKVQWRIEGSPPIPHLTVDAAIRYATNLRDEGNDMRIRKNAQEALAALKRLRPSDQ